MKRLFDICGAAAGLLLFSPVMILIALAIRISSHGPVLFSQARVGHHGRLFRVYKFRSMIANAERLGTSVTTVVDRRITGIGRLLRRTKLDELPQLWNVLAGEMSFVGPRPDVPEIVAEYTPEMRRILGVRPGITSIATLYLRDEESLLALSSDHDLVYEQILVPFKVALALKHVEQNSFFFDMRIVLQTVWALSFGRMVASPGEELVEIVRHDIAHYQPVPADMRMEQVSQSWKRYRELVQRCVYHMEMGDEPDGSAILAHHPSAERS
jgi:lipopolysaccharide/colanic/teichoic acid biosynthesis glycosyltransferase